MRDATCRVCGVPDRTCAAGFRITHIRCCDGCRHEPDGVALAIAAGFSHEQAWALNPDLDMEVDGG